MRKEWIWFCDESHFYSMHRNGTSIGEFFIGTYLVRAQYGRKNVFRNPCVASMVPNAVQKGGQILEIFAPRTTDIDNGYNSNNDSSKITTATTTATKIAIEITTKATKMTAATTTTEPESTAKAAPNCKRRHR